MIRLIAFDLGQVLVQFDIMRAINRIAPYSPLKKPDLKKKLFGKPLGIDFELGIITPEIFYQRLCRILQLAEDHPFTFDTFISVFNEIFTLNPDAVDMMHDLSASKSIGIISNTNILHMAYITQQFPVWDPVTYFILSYEIGFRKPDCRMYESLVSAAKVQPEEILLIDDKNENIRGALQAGFDTILFTSASNLKQELIHKSLL